jgi:hypothetical protein
MPQLRMYDFSCFNDHTFEALVDNPQEALVCPKCNLKATRVISPIRSILDPLSFPTSESKWIREHEKAGSKGRSD